MLLLVLSNAWIASFSLFKYSFDTQVIYNDLFIVLGLLLLVPMYLNEKDWEINDGKSIREKIAPDCKKEKHVKMYTIFSALSFVMIVVPLIFTKLSALLLYTIALALFVVSVVLYNNKRYSLLMLQFVYNFVCPVIGLYVCFYGTLLLIKYGIITLGKEFEDKFIDFVQVFFNVMTNVLGMGLIPVILFFVGVIFNVRYNKPGKNKKVA